MGMLTSGANLTGWRRFIVVETLSIARLRRELPNRKLDHLGIQPARQLFSFLNVDPWLEVKHHHFLAKADLVIGLEHQEKGLIALSVPCVPFLA